MKLRTRFALFSIFLSVMVIGATSYTTLYFLKSLVLKEIESSQASVAQNLKKVCEESQETGELILASNYVNSLIKTVNGLAFAYFVDKKNEMILTDRESSPSGLLNDRSLLQRNLATATKEEITFSNGKKVIQFAMPVETSKGKGIAMIGFYSEKVEENIQKSVERIQRIISYVAAGALAVGVLMSLIMAVQLTGPILKLAQGAQAIGNGNLDTQIDIKRNDEIGLLTHEFNAMAVKLKELDELKDAFVASVSHELRSPLSAISGYVELLTLKPINKLDPEKASKALNIILESTTRLTQFVNDVLDAAKIKAGKMEIHRVSMNPHHISESVFGLFYPLFEKKKITGKLEINPSLPSVPADIEKIRQVITNLLSNAYKFTPESGTITLTADFAKDKRDYVQFSVKDTGIGIPKAYQHMIFGRFQQVPGAKDKIQGPKGTGLGLVIAKGIVEAHGGVMGFESEENKGTTFFFTLSIKADLGRETVQAKALA